MRVIDRLFEFLTVQHIAPYSFERSCGIANGYLRKQQKGKGTIGSDTVTKITAVHKELNLVWLLTGKGAMILDNAYAEGLPSHNWREEEPAYSSQEVIKSLKSRVAILENALADKEKIIRLLEKELSKNSHTVSG